MLKKKKAGFKMGSRTASVARSVEGKTDIQRGATRAPRSQSRPLEEGKGQHKKKGQFHNEDRRGRTEAFRKLRRRHHARTKKIIHLATTNLGKPTKGTKALKDREREIPKWSLHLRWGGGK